MKCLINNVNELTLATARQGEVRYREVASWVFSKAFIGIQVLLLASEHPTLQPDASH